MNKLAANTKNEFYKLISRKKYIVLMIIGIIICTGQLGGNILLSKLSGGEITLKSNMIMSMLGFCTDILVPLAVFMAVTDLFAGEVQEDTMKAALLRPVSRFKVLTSKALAVFFLGAMYFAGIFIACTVLQLISGAPAPIGQSAAAYIIDLIPMFAVILMAILVNMLSKSPSLAMLLCICVYALFKYMNYFVSPFGQMLFTAYSRWHNLWLGSQLPFGALISKAGILFGSILILYTLSYIIFDRKDF